MIGSRPADPAETDLTDLEEGFIASAKSYGQRNGISHGARRSLGVPADGLRKAGITRSDGVFVRRDEVTQWPTGRVARC
jgi:hypothetical protein